MFEEWGFLIGEIWFLLLLAALLGLFAGWLIWSRNSTGVDIADLEQLQARNTTLEGELKTANSENAELRRNLEACRAKTAELTEKLAAKTSSTTPEPAHAVPQDQSRPAALTGPRDGKPDDLKQIKGIGIKLEKLCHQLGFYHFDQIAEWTHNEIAWVDENLEGFKGRVTRDQWVKQARILAGGGSTEFSKKVDKGQAGY